MQLVGIFWCRGLVASSHRTLSIHVEISTLRVILWLTNILGWLLNLPLFKEIIAFIIYNNKCWKIFNFHFPYSFHAYKHSIKQMTEQKYCYYINRTRASWLKKALLCLVCLFDLISIIYTKIQIQNLHSNFVAPWPRIIQKDDNDGSSSWLISSAELWSQWSWKSSRVLSK